MWCGAVIASTLGAGTHRITITGTLDVPSSRRADHERLRDSPCHTQRPLRGAVRWPTTHNANSGWTRRTSYGQAGIRARRPRRLASRVGMSTRAASAWLETSFRPGPFYRVLLIIGASLLAALGFVALVPRRTRMTWPTSGVPRRSSSLGLLTAARRRRRDDGRLAGPARGVRRIRDCASVLARCAPARDRGPGVGPGRGICRRLFARGTVLGSRAGRLRRPSAARAGGLVSAMAAGSARCGRPAFLSRMKGRSTTR